MSNDVESDATVVKQGTKVLPQQSAPSYCSAVSTKVRGETFVRAWGSASRPAALICDDGDTYVVKGPQTAHTAFNDQLVARLGTLIGAPVGRPSIVEVSQALINGNPELSHFHAGDAHGTRLITGCTDRIDNIAVDEKENIPRFASLSILFGWMQGADVQFIYSTSSPKLVHSVDHGHFFPNGPPWTPALLLSAAPATPYAPMITAANLTQADLAAPLDALAGIEEDQIANEVLSLPLTWGVDESAREAMLKYLLTRRTQLIACIAKK